MTSPEKPLSGPATASQALLLFVLLAAGGLRWSGEVLADHVKPDETVYVHAAELWSAGRSPYEERIFFYPPVFAYVGSKLTEAYGTLGYLKIQRALNLAGICLATWLALRIAAWRTWPALLFGVGWLWLSPVVALPIAIGNATGLPTALTLTGLLFWRRRPIASGAALGLGQALKPVAPLAALAFLAHRRGAGSGAALRAGLAALGALGLLLCVGLAYLPGLLGNATGSGTQPYNFSLHRVLAGFGAELRPIWIFALVGLLGLSWIATRKLSGPDFLTAVLTLNLLAAPILWAHSMLLLLPIQLIALTHLSRSVRSAASPRSGGGVLRALFPHVLAGLAILSTVLSASVGGLAEAPAWVQSGVLAVPFAAILYLGLYVLGAGASERRRAQRRPSQAG